ncbi:hypothetical protein [Streptomyces sp. IBSBF 2806]|uniref:hypothetical protein n=1 Tax=Streptomyces sp. IBSBF 2806 TaxID=2903529 RepID=UPI002FDBAF82
MCANDMRAAAVLAVPFLIRIAADVRHPHRADALAEVSCPARARHFGVASRDQLLLHRATQHDGLYDHYGVEVSGYPAGWSIAAARASIAADTALLRTLLDDPDPDPAIRIRAAYALAAASDPTTRSAQPSSPGWPPSPTRSSVPPWPSPPPKPPARIPTRKRPSG